MKNTKDTLRSFILDRFTAGSPDVEIEGNTSFLESGLIDSTGVMELVDFLEEEFGIEVEDSELLPQNLDSINNICRYLQSKGVDGADD